MSLPLPPGREGGVEALSDLYQVRRSLNRQASESNDRELLHHWAHVEDWYGSAAPQAYLRLVNTLLRQNAPKEQILQICHRGLQVSLREERFDAARQFAGKCADLGNPCGTELLRSSKPSAEDRVNVLGGVNAIHFLTLGKGKPNADRLFLDYTRLLSSVASDGDPTEFQQLARRVHAYFRHLSTLAALGTRSSGHLDIVLTLQDETGAQLTQRVLTILGLKLSRSKPGLKIESAQDRSKTDKQELREALGLDEETIQQALAAGRPYVLKIPLDSVPVYPAAPIWKTAFPESRENELADLFVDDPRLPQLYLALNSMDRAAADALLKVISLPALSERYSRSLYFYSTALALSGSRAEVPGGSAADPVWRDLVGESPLSPGAFFKALLSRDDGDLIMFFYTLSELDIAHQRFFTRSPARAKRFYALFRESPEVQRARTRRLMTSTLLDFFRDVPLTDSGSVKFPGSPEVWMAASGHSESIGPLAKMTRQLEKTAAPDDEDAILVHLATTVYTAGMRQLSELANFTAVAQVNQQRSEPLSPDSALLLAQSYTKFGALFPYFAALDNLDDTDFQMGFALFAKLKKLGFVKANVRFGEIHSYLAMLCLIEQSGLETKQTVRQLYRRGVERYSKAGDGGSWTTASLAAVDDLAQLIHGSDVEGRDAAIRTLLIGGARGNKESLAETGDASYRLRSEEAYQRILDLQKVPSLDALFAVRDSLNRLGKDDAALANVRKQISSLMTINPPYEWHVTPQTREWLERCQTASLEKIASKLRDGIDSKKLADGLLAKLEPWMELAMAGQIYARYLDPSDVVVSEDPMLLRKQVFTDEGIFWRGPDRPADFVICSSGEGSYFTGGFAQFSLAAGRARAEGNHLSAPAATALAGAVFASVRGTDWHLLTESVLQKFGANVRLAREWIVESATSDQMFQQLAQQSVGLLSFRRRKTLLEGVTNRDWVSVWESLSVSDLYFLGAALVKQAPDHLWMSPALIAMKQAAAQTEELDLLGQVAPDLSGSAAPQLRRYDPYEGYERYYLALPVAERAAELKLYLAWLADSSAWQPATLAAAASATADAVMKRINMRDRWQWSAALDGFRTLKPEFVESLLSKQ